MEHDRSELPQLYTKEFAQYAQRKVSASRRSVPKILTDWCRTWWSMRRTDPPGFALFLVLGVMLLCLEAVFIAIFTGPIMLPLTLCVMMPLLALMTRAEDRAHVRRARLDAIARALAASPELFEGTDRLERQIRYHRLIIKTSRTLTVEGDLVPEYVLVDSAEAALASLEVEVRELASRQQQAIDAHTPPKRLKRHRERDPSVT